MTDPTPELNSPRRIFVFEHVCGGGMIDEPIPPALAAQGYAMLAAVIEDFVRDGRQVTTLRDGRVDAVPGADERVPDDAAHCADLFDDAARRADAVLIVAPECDGHLEGWTRRLEAVDARSLGCTREAVCLCADKRALTRDLECAGVPVPVMHEGMPPTRARIVSRPRFGAGCEETWLHRAAPSPMPADDGRVLHEFVPGCAASVSLVVQGDAAIALPAGRQQIRLGESDPASVDYQGGVLPLDEPLQQRAAALGRRAVAAVPGLRGFVGVDLVLAGRADDDVVLEINPRLTMSYVGLRALCTTNLARALLDTSVMPPFREGSVSFDAAGVLYEIAPSRYRP